MYGISKDDWVDYFPESKKRRIIDLPTIEEDPSELIIDDSNMQNVDVRSEEEK